MMRPSKVLSTGNCEFRDSGIAHYYNKLVLPKVFQIPIFPSFYETIKNRKRKKFLNNAFFDI